ncbi:hypothetical protein TWF718_008483 [Orbilia javanica]|uniref:SAP domain-containing protein n=1 Tax=Orbilia javanica TaxID=47235 RepID=A0AAN8N152_9PEZI
MDPSALKVTELKAELKKRGLAVGGLKKDLVERLTEAIEREKAEAAAPEEEEEEEEAEEEEEEAEEEQTEEHGGEEQAEAVVDDKADEKTEDESEDKLEKKVEEQDGAAAETPEGGNEKADTKEDVEPEGPEEVEEPEKMDEDSKPAEETKEDKDEPDTSASTEQTTFTPTISANKLTENSLEDVEMVATEEVKQSEAVTDDKMEIEKSDEKPVGPDNKLAPPAPTVETAAATPVPAQEEPKQPENILEPITSAPTPLQPPEAVKSIEADLSNRRKRSRSPSVRVDEIEAKKARIHEEIVEKDEIAMSDAPVISTGSPERGQKSPRDRSRSRSRTRSRSRSRSRTESPSQSRQRPSIAASTKDARFKSLFNKEENSPTNPVAPGAATPPRSEDEEETSPSIHPATRGLYIRELVRPLQESQLKTHLIQLASKTTDPSSADPSALESIYLDGIKTHCFAVFSTVQACSRARNGVHGKIFPNEKNRRVLFADYVPEDKISSWVAREKDNRGVRFVITYGDSEDGVEAIHEEFSSGNGGRGSIGGGNRRGSGATAPIDAPSGPRGRSSFSNNGSAGNTFTTGANAVPQGVRVVSLDELFLSTKTKPKIYYKPVDAATVKERIAKGPVEGEVRGRRIGGRGGDGGAGAGNSDSWRGGFGGGGRGGRGGRRGGGDSWTNKDRERDRDFERRDWVRDGGRGDRRGPFRERSPRDRW